MQIQKMILAVLQLANGRDLTFMNERQVSVILDIQTLDIGYGQPTVSLYAASNLNKAFLVANNTSQAADGYNTIVTLLLIKHLDILQSYLFILSNKKLTLCQCPMS